MIVDDIGKELHIKATRGLVLSDGERRQLDSWYDQMDQEEFLSVQVNDRTFYETQQKIEATLIGFNETKATLRAVTGENERIKQEIAHLRRQLDGATKTA